jgi:hypothetical protein
MAHVSNQPSTACRCGEKLCGTLYHLTSDLHSSVLRMQNCGGIYFAYLDLNNTNLITHMIYQMSTTATILFDKGSSKSKARDIWEGDRVSKQILLFIKQYDQNLQYADTCIYWIVQPQEEAIPTLLYKGQKTPRARLDKFFTKK